MRNILLIIAIFCISAFSNAQGSLMQNNPIYVGYLGHYISHPGLKIGTLINLKNFEKKGNLNKNKVLGIIPEIGFYVHPKNHLGLRLNTEFGIKASNETRKSYFIYGFGIGYLLQINSGTTYVLSENGEITEKDIASRGYFLPTLNMTYGYDLNEKLGLYSKISAGTKVWYNTGVALEGFFELGIKFNLK